MCGESLIHPHFHYKSSFRRLPYDITFKNYCYYIVRVGVNFKEKLYIFEERKNLH